MSFPSCVRGPTGLVAGTFLSAEFQNIHTVLDKNELLMSCINFRVHHNSTLPTCQPHQTFSGKLHFGILSRTEFN
jgi:hypothetical protein